MKENNNENSIKKLIFFFTLFSFFIFCFSLTGLAEKLPSPEEFFGFKVGADYHLLSYGRAVEYWKKLEELSGRIKLFEYGKSSEGRPMILAAVSSADNLAELTHYKEISKRLSLVRGLSKDEALRLSSAGKAIVWIDGGLHATEVAPAQHIIQLTYDLVTDESKKAKRIRQEVIAMLVLPNPDGMDMVAEWYHSHLSTPFETSPLPWLYQKYIGHDNNRDSFMLSVPETKNINQVVHHDWYPHIFYNHHQRAPFPSLIFVPPDSEPTNPNLHPLLLRWQNFFGAAMAMAFEAEGKQGVISRYLYDTWYPGYVTQVCDFHNIISTFSETFLYHYATPHYYTVRDFPKEYRDFTISLFFTNPWQGGWWRLRDAVEYCLTSSTAVLDLAAKHREELLYAKYAMGRETMERYKKEPPYGWIIPQEQRDHGATAFLLDKLIALDLEIYQAEEPFRADGIDYPEGTYILPTSQPFGRLLKTLFEIQVYPDLRKYPDLWQSIVEPQKLTIPPLRSYDVLGWTLPLQMGVETVTMNTRLEVKTKRIQKASRTKGRVSGSGNYGFLIPYQTNNSVIALNRILEAGGQVFWISESFQEGGKSYSPGDLVVPLSKFSAPKMERLAEDLSLQLNRIKKRPSVKTFQLKRPRIALYQPWTANIDEGWTRLILENYEFLFTILHNAEIRAGQLQDRFDVIILPNQWAQSIINGRQKGTMPPKYAGGISSSGVRNLKKFVEAGGTLVTLGAACNLPLEQFKLGVKNILESLKPEEFFASGLLVKVRLDQNHPLAFGMPEEIAGFFSNSPTFQTWPAGDQKRQPRVVGKFPEEDIVLSGWMVGEKHLKNKAAVIEVPLGQGKVILLGIRVQQRGQTVATFKLLFNSLFYSAASPGNL
ncbi:MAG: hypothetical protein GTO17_06430 [Candidatus Aminicenantes bacterium]|nr:hypothetical protein [Candidatus Aminicenantes bacterium]